MAASAPAPSSAPRPAAAGSAVRSFGRYQLLRLLGKSTQSMLWLVLDTRDDIEMMLAMPRTQPRDDAALTGWLQRARRTTRLTHPHLARISDVGEVERWPYVAYHRGSRVTWAERVGSQGLAAAEAAEWAIQALQALAFAHQAGMGHRDLQPFSLLVDEQGDVELLGLEVAEFMPAGPAPDPDTITDKSAETMTDGLGHQAASDERRQQRQAAEQDVLALGLLLHQLLCGAPPLDEPDIARAIARLPPLGRDIVRLPFTVPRPIPDALRAIVNRATDRQPRQRYRSARTFESALDGWLRASAATDAGPITLLLDRMRSVGLLPAMPGGADRAARLALMESGHTNELAELVLQDFALAFELLRSVNLAHTQSGHAGSGPVLATHRAIAMVGLDGVRRAALSLRAWPGPLNEQGAAALEALIRRVKRAASLARTLQPPGYDTEVVYVITALQNLGWLVVQYHFPDDAQQIRRLMQSVPSDKEGQPDEPGMSVESAAFAVLGVDIDALATAVMRHWGLDESVQHMVRRLSPAAPVHPPDNDLDMLRTVASCANEAIEAIAQPARLAGAALHRVALRYGRPLGLTLKDLQEALQPQVDVRPAATQGPAPRSARPAVRSDGAPGPAPTAVPGTTAASARADA